MKIRIEKGAIFSGVIRTQGINADKSQNVIGLRGDEKGGQLFASDRTMAVYCTLDCRVEQPGEVFVPGRFFSDVIKELPQGEVIIESTANSLKITAGEHGEFTMKLPIAVGHEWQPEPIVQNFSNSIELPSIKLSYMIDQVQFCISQDAQRNFGGVGFLHRAENKKLRLVGTDGFRLSYCDITYELPETFLPNGICLSKKALNEIARMCSEGFERIGLAISEDETTLCASVSGYQIFMSLSAIKYPQYQAALPNYQSDDVVVSRSLLQSGAKRVLLASGKTRALQMEFAPGTLTLSSKDVGSAEGRETIELDEYQGTKCRLAVNGKFLSDVFSTTNSDGLSLGFKDDEKPIWIVPTREPNDCRSRHVLVPIRERD